LPGSACAYNEWLGGHIDGKLLVASTRRELLSLQVSQLVCRKSSCAGCSQIGGDLSTVARVGG